MTLPQRDAAVIHYVARFHQLSSTHINELLFADRASHTPCARTLKRLVDSKYLHRLEHRMVGGAKGGSGVYVYALGRRGYFLHFDGRYSPARAVNYHALAVADSFLQLRRLERAGQVSLLGYSTEPDCWVTIGGVELHPDMYVDLQRRDGARLRAFFEVDMGTEGQKQLKGKLEAYWLAYNGADVDQWPEFPSCWWVAVDDERAKELTWLIGQGSEEARALFRVCTREQLPALLS